MLVRLVKVRFDMATLKKRVIGEIVDATTQRRRKKTRKPCVLFELVHQQRFAFFPPPLVTDWVFDFDFIQDRSVIQLDEQCVSDRSLGGIVVVDTELLVFDTVDLGTECVDAGVRSSGIGAGMARSVW